jgi:HTH-type transcriptional regulator / antitoxin HigA
MTSLAPEKDKWTPNWATHPGEHLAEYLEVRGLTQAEFARLAGLTPKLVSEIINGKNPVTPETAIKIERVLGLSAYIWVGLQAAWDLFHARQRTRPAILEQKSWLSLFPIRELKSIGILRNTTDENMLYDDLMSFFGIANPEALSIKMRGLSVQHRKSKVHKSSPEHVLTWLMLGERKVRSLEMPPFDKANFTSSVHTIKKLTNERAEVFEPQMKALCAAAGVALIIEKPISKTCLFGSARWLDRQTAIIQMSLRMKTNDHFWWTFFHECGHVILHQGKNFADDDKGFGDYLEDEADRWAESILYGRDGLNEILSAKPRSEAEVRKWADHFELHPGIIAGMLQHYGIIPYRNLNGLKAKFQWVNC